MLVLKRGEAAAVRDLLLELLDLEVGGALRLPGVLDLRGVARVHELADGVLQIVTKKLRWAVGDAVAGALEWATLCECAATIEGEELGEGLVANCLNLPRDD